MTSLKNKLPKVETKAMIQQRKIKIQAKSLWEEFIDLLGCPRFKLMISGIYIFCFLLGQFLKILA